MGPQAPGVGLYCRKVLIDPHPEGLLPEWLRFLRGVLDSEDLPLNISRESMQDSALVKKLGAVVTNRFLKFLDKQATDNPTAYDEFYLKEGLVASFEHQEALAKLLRFESSFTEEGKHTSLGEYVERMKEGQEEIYYLVGPSREAIAEGPHLATLEARGFEVAFFTEAVDDYVLESLREFSGKKIVPAAQVAPDPDQTPEEGGESLPEDERTALAEWSKETLGDEVAEVTTGIRSADHPVVALLPEDSPNAQMRAMLEAMGQEVPAVKPRIELNPSHPLVRQLATLRTEKPELAGRLLKHLAGNAALAAGLPGSIERQQKELASLLVELL
jgi:molecular chaperone HtpG